jgi:hypothetical protein
MSRFIRSGGSTSGALTSADVCNILCSYQGTLSASNACLVCNLRTQYDIICMCTEWTCCYGTTFEVQLPTTEYNEFEFGMFGICNFTGGCMCNFLQFGNCVCYCLGTSPPAYCGVQYNIPSGSCIISCSGPAACAVCFANQAGSSSSILVNFKRSWNYNSCLNNCVNCPQIFYCGYYTSRDRTLAERFMGSTTCSTCTYWRDAASTTCDQFTRFRICSNCAIQGGTGAYWYILGMKDRTCAI